MRLKRFIESIECFEEAIKIKSDYAKVGIIRVGVYL